MGKPVQNTPLVDLLKILLTVGIVLRHSTPADIPEGGGWVSLLFKGVVLVTEVCVPLFFVLSGFLFLLSTPEDPAASWFAKKLGRRVHSLLIPYLIANLFALACYAAASHWYPQMLSGFLGENWKDPLFAFWKGPVNLSLWFIRELMLVSLLSPVVFLLVRYTRWWGVLVLGVLTYFGLTPAPWLWFSLGAMTAFDPRTRALVCKVQLNIPPAWRGWCYFVYLYHYIPILAVKKMAYAQAGSLWMQPMAGLAAALTVLLLLSGAYLILRRWLPRVLGLLIGGK